MTSSGISPGRNRAGASPRVREEAGSRRPSIIVLCRFLLSALAVGSCRPDPVVTPSPTPDPCIPCDAQARIDGIGRLTFEQAGDDNAARELMASCRYNVHNNHKGGTGDTLQVGFCAVDGEFGVILVWAYQEFTGYRVCRPGFQGGFLDGSGFTEGCRTVGRYFRQ